MPGSQRVFLGNIPFDSRTRDVERFFRGYGKLGEISIKNGYGFVDFEDYRDAEDAVADLNGKDMNGDRVRVELAHDRREKERARRNRRSPRRFEDRGRRRGNPPGRRTDHRIIVENISSRTSWQDLKDFFRTAGDISYTSAHKIRNGEGLVEFSDRRGMEYAIEKLDGSEIDGRKIRLVEEKKRSRSRSASRSRSRSPRRSASPRRRSRSPQRRSSRSPQRRSKSPDGRSSRSPARRSESPKSSRSRSRSRSGDRR